MKRLLSPAPVGLPAAAIAHDRDPAISYPCGLIRITGRGAGGTARWP